ncbi:MAG: hypothetical protein GY928_18260 [Colwellia sp.]|nr:hypothetical protein [Colwellia sp.]
MFGGVFGLLLFDALSRLVGDISDLNLALCFFADCLRDHFFLLFRLLELLLWGLGVAILAMQFYIDEFANNRGEEG